MSADEIQKLLQQKDAAAADAETQAVQATPLATAPPVDLKMSNVEAVKAEAEALPVASLAAALIQGQVNAALPGLADTPAPAVASPEVPPAAPYNVDTDVDDSQFGSRADPGDFIMTGKFKKRNGKILENLRKFLENLKQNSRKI